MKSPMSSIDADAAPQFWGPGMITATDLELGPRKVIEEPRLNQLNWLYEWTER